MKWKNDVSSLRAQDYIGGCELFLPDAIRARGHTWKGLLTSPRGKSCESLGMGVVLRVEELSKEMSSDVVKIVIEGQIRQEGQYFFKLLRGNTSSEGFVPVYQSEGVNIAKEAAKWRTVVVGAAGLMRDNPNCPLSLELYKWERSGEHRRIEEFRFTFAQLAEAAKWNGSFGIVRTKV